MTNNLVARQKKKKKWTWCPLKTPPNEQTAKSWASMNSGKVTKNTKHFKCQMCGTNNKKTQEWREEELLCGGQGRGSWAKPCFPISSCWCDSKGHVKEIRGIIHYLLPHNLWLVHLNYTIICSWAYVSWKVFSFLGQIYLYQPISLLLICCLALGKPLPAMIPFQHF